MKHMRHLRIAGSALLTALFLTVLLCGGIVFAASDTSGTTKISLVAKEVNLWNSMWLLISSETNKSILAQ